jgi:hypothetical protein
MNIFCEPHLYEAKQKEEKEKEERTLADYLSQKKST